MLSRMMSVLSPECVSVCVCVCVCACVCVCVCVFKQLKQEMVSVFVQSVNK